MRAVVQRASQARVTVENRIVAEIAVGLVVFIAISPADTAYRADKLAERILQLRVFEDRSSKMNLDIRESGGSFLLVPNFTLYANCEKGRRPDFRAAAPREHAQPIFDRFLEYLTRSGVRTEAGVFGANMEVSVVNRGPVTLVLDVD